MSTNGPKDDDILIEESLDWIPETETVTSKKSKNSDDDVFMLRDPFQSKTIEIEEAQNRSDELDLDSDLDLDLEDDDAEDAAAASSLAEVSDEAINRLAKKLNVDLDETDSLKNGYETLEADAAAPPATDDVAEAEEREALEIHDGISDEALAAAMPKVDDNGDYDLNELESCIEALLFVSDKGLSAKKLKELLAPDYATSRFKEAIARLVEKYQSPRFGIELVNVAGGYEFRTKPGRAALAKKLARVQAHRLSRGAMETLAIIAYRQPVMKEDIDFIRGVDSSHFLRTLMEKNLVHISGRSELPGRPMLYQTTSAFLEIFGLADLASMPPLKEVESLLPASSSSADEEDPNVVKLKELVSNMNMDRERISYNAQEDEQILSEIREKVKSIPVTTATLEERKLQEKQALVGETELLSEPVAAPVTPLA